MFERLHVPSWIFLFNIIQISWCRPFQARSNFLLCTLNVPSPLLCPRDTCSHLDCYCASISYFRKLKWLLVISRILKCPMLLLCGQIVQHYLDLLGKGGVSGQAVSRLGNVLSSLVNFLTSLKASLSTQPFSSATNGTQSHCWGQKYSTTKQVSVQITNYYLLLCM